jgi:hypothetical protein
MYKLYESLKSCDRSPTITELQLARNVIPMDSPAAQEAMRALKMTQSSLSTLFDKQRKKPVSCL